MTAFAGKSGSAPASVAQPAAAPDAHGWSHGWSRAQYQRAFSAFAGITYTSLAAVGSVLGAYIVLYGLPKSLGAAGPWYQDLPSTLSVALGTVLSTEFRPYLALALASPLIHLVIFRRLRLYAPELGSTFPFAGMRVVFQGSVLGGLLLAAAGTLIRPESSGIMHSALFYVYAAILLFMGVSLGHSAVQIAQLTVRHTGVGRIRVAIAGNVDGTAGIRNALDARKRDYEYRGLITTADEATEETESSILGALPDLEALINDHRLDEIILAFDPSALEGSRRLSIAQTCWRLGVDLKMVSPFHPYFKTPGRIEVLGDTPLVHVHRMGLYTTRSQFLKRAIDILVSLSGLIVLSPLLLVVAVLVRTTSKGPVLFTQARPGLYGRVFHILKFRSMVADADGDLHREAQRRLIEEGAAAQQTSDGRPIFGKVANDPRVTAVGRFIRRTSIDELPQLINVLRGEMSLVGPRPSVLYELEHYSERHKARLNCRPGITGLWQVSGRSRLSFEEMVDLDLKYISSWSLWLDIKILIRTIPVVLNIDEAY